MPLDTESTTPFTDVDNDRSDVNYEHKYQLISAHTDVYKQIHNPMRNNRKAGHENQSDEISRARNSNGYPFRTDSI